MIFFNNVIGLDMSLPHSYMYIQDTLLDADLPKYDGMPPNKTTWKLVGLLNAACRVA